VLLSRQCGIVFLLGGFACLPVEPAARTSFHQRFPPHFGCWRQKSSRFPACAQDIAGATIFLPLLSFPVPYFCCLSFSFSAMSRSLRLRIPSLFVLHWSTPRPKLLYCSLSGVRPLWASQSATSVHLPTTTFSLSCSALAEAVKGTSFVNCVFPISGVLMCPGLILKPPDVRLELF
jgi:hypothetical protein